MFSLVVFEGFKYIFWWEVKIVYLCCGIYCGKKIGGVFKDILGKVFFWVFGKNMIN